MKRMFIISRYKEDYKWITKYSNDYIVYNKGDPIENDNHVLNVENIGCNQRDIFNFVYNNYKNLPDIMIFTQGSPFDHCKEDIFENLIKKKEFTSLEYYGDIPANNWENRTEDGQFLEINNSWYIYHENKNRNQICRYFSFDEFMNYYFEDYKHLEWIRFAPGSQYLVPKENILHYPKNFWLALMNELNAKSPTEAYIIERALWYILSGAYKLRNTSYYE